ncbi:MAG: single-stranded-DNA-specific exonuclease RecJ [Rhodothermaceae bacterium]|nr:MAG: single-stranded-DNA-specific exonuclease RecJ [Rhodothermaceae bacterium]
MKYRWALRPVENPDAVARLQRELNNLPEALARALVLRGIETFEAARHFFRPSREDLHDPFLMQDMEAAADRVATALTRGERILVYGDYDVDGTTSTALLMHFLRSRGASAQFFIPNRFRDGYGLGPAGIEAAAGFGASLIIALDCGVTAVEEAAAIRARGMDLIICDHHTTKDRLPEAVAVLDPKRPDCPYPFKELCGCGVTFKLVQAVLARLGEAPEAALAYLDLVAVATASDIVPVGGENRILLSEGLARLRTAPRPGLHALAEAAGLDLHTCSTSKIVFGLGPRINAAGRLSDAALAVELLLCEDPARALEYAHRLDALNQQRRSLDAETVREAAHMAERQLSARTRHTLVLHHPGWHLGVIGIVASRIVERFYRPTIMLSTVDGLVKGSARSIEGVNVFEALTACADLLATYGGHDYAAGLALEEANLPAFRERFDEAVRAVVTPEMLLPTLALDAPLSLADIDARFWAVLKQFAPFGPGNDTPVFHARDLAVAGHPRTVGADGTHLKFAVRQRTGGDGSHPVMPVIGFKLHRHLPTVERSLREGLPLELAFSIEENRWNGRTTLQLRARDLRLGERPATN